MHIQVWPVCKIKWNTEEIKVSKFSGVLVLKSKHLPAK